MNKPIFILVLLLCFFFQVAAQRKTAVKAIPVPEPKIEIFISAAFPGGVDSLLRYLAKNAHYPPVARDANVEGRVIVQFFINEDSTIAEARVVRGIGAGCDEEALRLVKQMPKWRPAIYNGRPTRVIYTLPVMFRLQ